jgi:hypothetical protein
MRLMILAILIAALVVFILTDPPTAKQPAATSICTED